MDLTLIISIISVIIALFSIYKSDKASKNSILLEKKLSSATNELSIRNNISNARNRVDDILILLAEDNISKSRKEAIKKVFHSAMEDQLNHYNKACALYLDEKIDKIRFKKDFNNEIRNFFDNKEINKKYFNRNNTRFHALIKINEEWFNVEND